LFGGYGLALAALALVVFGAYDSYPAKGPSCIALGQSLKVEGTTLVDQNCIKLWHAL